MFFQFGAATHNLSWAIRILNRTGGKRNEVGISLVKSSTVGKSRLIIWLKIGPAWYRLCLCQVKFKKYKAMYEIQI